MSSTVIVRLFQIRHLFRQPLRDVQSVDLYSSCIDEREFTSAATWHVGAPTRRSAAHRYLYALVADRGCLSRSHVASANFMRDATFYCTLKLRAARAITRGVLHRFKLKPNTSAFSVVTSIYWKPAWSGPLALPDHFHTPDWFPELPVMMSAAFKPNISGPPWFTLIFLRELNALLKRAFAIRISVGNSSESSLY